jgi:hypothetical protein
MKKKIREINKESFLFPGVSTTEGDHWERQRNFFHDHLTDLVDGKGAKGFHEVIMDEIQDMKRSLTAKVKQSWSIRKCANICKQNRTQENE